MLGPTSTKVGKEIWTAAEVEQKPPYDYDDPRPEPDYDTVFRQAVSAEDVFLGTGNKKPTTASCEELVVRKVTWLPLHSAALLLCCCVIRLRSSYQESM